MRARPSLRVLSDPLEYQYGRGVVSRPIPRRLESFGDAPLSEAASAASERGIQHRCELFAGDVSDVIVELASAIEADLVVVGSRARKLPKPGSVSRRVLRRAAQPVLVAKERKSQRLAAESRSRSGNHGELLGELRSLKRCDP
jgi:nucleotide-binding universal stress UspA family protein